VANHRIGIMQGRLVASANGELDCPPGPRWREEFEIAASLALNHIELVAEKVVDLDNPIWSATGRGELLTVADAVGVNLISLCANETLTHRFDDPGFALDLATRLAPLLADIQLRIVVLPLLEASDLSVLDWPGAARAVHLFAAAIAERGARVVLELGVPAAEALRFQVATDSQHVGLCYDVGNSAALGFDVPTDLRQLGPQVWHLHAKDKDSAGQNVRFGTGSVPFDRVFAELAAQGFDGLITMEATRGEDPRVTAAEHRAFLLACGDRTTHARENVG
jgi:L-ribulose-5-phosphate 3-epimerase